MNPPAAIRVNELRATAAALGAAALPHVSHLPLWILALIPGAIALRLGLGRAPRRWLLIALVVAVFAAVIARYGTIAGPSAGGAFFCAMVALKYLETRTRRDNAILLCLACFLAASVFLTSQAIGIAVLVVLALFVALTAMTFVAEPDGPSIRARSRRVGVVLLQAVPIMVVLFVLFPRLPGPLWGLGDEETGRTGLDDRMSPGDITRLTESSAVAFRVRFEGDPPPRSRRYWRGPVLWHFDGRTWTRGEQRHRGLAQPIVHGGRLQYTVIMEPNDRNWLFGLDIPIGAEGAVARKTGYNLTTRDRIDSVRRFPMRSALDYTLEPDLPDARRRRALALPDRGAGRTRALARRWQREAGSPRGVVDRALAFLRRNDFVYTLSPPALDDDPVDTFLFDTRAGFCEHFASAFAVLMRAAGIPARIVTGYQGGETNSVGDYMIVRQSDAHAWTEVWLPDQGWTRVDPTGAVSSARVDAGISGVNGANGRLPLLSRRDGGFIRQAALLWDSVNYGWNRFVLGYGPALQRQLLERLGLAGLGQWALALVMLACVGLVLAAVWLLALRPAGPRDPIEREWRRARRRLTAAGIVPGATEGPADLAARVRRERPDLGPAFTRVASVYIGLRFRPGTDHDAPRRLRDAVRAFRPRRRGR